MPDGSYTDLMKHHGFIPADHQAPRFFPVSAGDVYDAQGRVIEGYQRIARDDTGKTLALHTTDYKLVPYEQNFMRFEAAIEKSGLDRTGMHIATDMTHDGGRVFRQYLFPAHTTEISTGGDAVALRIIMFDSYDGTSAFRGLAGHFRFVCANTTVAGNSIIEIRAKHVANFDQRAGELIDSIVHAAAEAVKHTQRMRAWAMLNLRLDDARELIGKLPQAPESLQDRLFTEYAVKHGEAGTAWDLYNVLSYWSTHGDKGKHAAQTKAQREARVLSLTETKIWKEIVNA